MCCAGGVGSDGWRCSTRSVTLRSGVSGRVSLTWVVAGVR